MRKDCVIVLKVTVTHYEISPTNEASNLPHNRQVFMVGLCHLRKIMTEDFPLDFLNLFEGLIGAEHIEV